MLSRANLIIHKARIPGAKALHRCNPSRGLLDVVMKIGEQRAASSLSLTHKLALAAAPLASAHVYFVEKGSIFFTRFLSTQTHYSHHYREIKKHSVCVCAPILEPVGAAFCARRLLARETFPRSHCVRVWNASYTFHIAQLGVGIFSPLLEEY
jgi:hypothetical protein